MLERPYTELQVWQRCRALVGQIYDLTRGFPREEMLGLTNQMRRAAVSIPSNIAEGCGRQHQRDTIQFLFVARGSLFELETQCYLAADQQYLSAEQLQAVLANLNDCRKLLQGFIRYYRNLSPSSGTTLPDNGQLKTDN
ncbi:four helix bundle protein [Hymenobacter oligotrophus]|uniref:Four helix bundle protein n=1 Tax=Hymenobacter oligotrophus TaxID=2319843 RepID=A0A3B7R7F8_9BACT|nr:four helix bundle protein [Hymenobacter oligotrophus]AYA35586.1 four helix bundle protein [Hymenobacter oligotrophus]